MIPAKVWISSSIHPRLHALLSGVLVTWYSYALGQEEVRRNAFLYYTVIAMTLHFVMEAVRLRRIRLVGDELWIEGPWRASTLRLSQVESVSQPQYLRGYHGTLVYRDESGQRRSLWFYPAARIELIRERLWPPASASSPSA